MKQVKVLRNDKGEAYLQEVINDWLIEQYLVNKDIDIENIHVLNNGSMIIFYEETGIKTIEETIIRYKEKKEKDNYFKNK